MANLKAFSNEKAALQRSNLSTPTSSPNIEYIKKKEYISLNKPNVNDSFNFNLRIRSPNTNHIEKQLNQTNFVKNLPNYNANSYQNQNSTTNNANSYQNQSSTTNNTQNQNFEKKYGYLNNLQNKTKQNYTLESKLIDNTIPNLNFNSYKNTSIEKTQQQNYLEKKNQTFSDSLVIFFF